MADREKHLGGERARRRFCVESRWRNRALCVAWVPRAPRSMAGGLPETEEYRVAPQFRTSPEMSPEQQLAILSSAGIDPNEKIVKLMMGGGFDTEQANHILNSRPARAAEIPSANGIGNARSLAKMYAATIGEIDGVRLLQTRSVDRARVPQTRLEAGTHADVKDIGRQDAQEQQLLNAGVFKTGATELEGWCLYDQLLLVRSETGTQ
jgi:hypothetical protein